MSPRTILLLSLLLGLAPVHARAQPKPTDALAREREQLRGCWKAIDISLEDRHIPFGRGKWVRFIFAGEKLILDDSVKSTLGEGTCKLDPAARPHGIDLSFPGEKPVAGIYEVDGDTLRICHPLGPDLPRPREFSSKGPKGKPQLLLVLRRERPGRPLPGNAGKLRAERDKVAAEVARAVDGDRPLADVIALLMKRMAIEEQLYGYTHEELGETLLMLANISALDEQFARAQVWAQRGQLLFENLYGESNWKAGEARFLRTHFDQMRRLTAAQRLRVLQALAQENSAEESWHRGRTRQALQSAEKAQTVLDELLGPRHRFALRLRSSTALFHFRLGDVAKAEKEMVGLMPVMPAVFGMAHPNCGMLQNNLGYLYCEQNDFDRAAPLLRRARVILEAALGKDSPQLAQTLSNLAHVHLAREERQEAQAVLDQALRIHEAQKAPSFDFAVCLSLVAELRHRERNFAAARKLHDRALAMLKQVQGEKSAGYAHLLVNRADLLIDQLRYDDADKDCQQALKICDDAPEETRTIRALALERLAYLQDLRGRFHDAEEQYRQVLAVYQKAVGAQHVLCAGVLRKLAELHGGRGDFDQAERELRDALDIVRRTVGEKSMAFADCLASQALLHGNRGQYRLAEPLLVRVRDLYRDLRGPRHPAYARSLEDLAGNALHRADYARALTLFREARSLREAIQGKEHPGYAHSLLKLGEAERLAGRPEQAEPRLTDACAILRRAQAPELADALQQLAEVYHDRGDFARAEPLYREALDRLRDLHGEMHANYGAALNSLGILYADMGDLKKAEKLLLQAAAILEKCLGTRHPTFAVTLNSLAALSCKQRSLDGAVKLLTRARGIFEASGLEDPLQLNLCLNNLAVVHAERGDLALAEEAGRQAVAGARRIGTHHPRYLTTLNTLATAYILAGQADRGAPLLNEALELARKTHFPPRSEAVLMANLGLLELLQGKTDRAAEHLAEAVTVLRRQLERDSVIQSERQQLADLALQQHHLHLYLTLAARKEVTAEQAYALLLPWKGSVLARQQALQLTRRHPELAEPLAELRAISSQLAALWSASPDPGRVEQWQREIDALVQKRDRLEADLARRSAAYRSQRDLTRRSPDDLKNALPPGVALVDYFEYLHATPQPGSSPILKAEPHLLAFVLRRDRPIQLIDLGPTAAPGRKSLAEVVEAWRQSYGAADNGAVGQDLRKRLWLPLVPHLDGVRAVLLSPDGPLNRLPFAALPGREPGSYLLEDLAVATVPVPLNLPELLAASLNEPAREGMLIVGHVDYNADPGPTVAASPLPPWLTSQRSGAARALPGTQVEADAILELFQGTHAQQTGKPLLKSAATKAALLRHAPGHRYVHLATHGFFVRPEAPSALRPPDTVSAAAQLLGARQEAAGWSPELRSGLVLAGYNAKRRPGRADGILSALEVAALDLSGTELAVVSACETGLGEVAGGEGVLGLQRAFHQAGARTTVASLWKVDDDATQRLMTLFYDNLWRKKMGKAEALRQAQLTLLHDPKAAGSSRAFDVSEDRERAIVRTDPRLWAAWILSGDPGDLSAVQPVHLDPESGAGAARAPDAGAPGWLAQPWLLVLAGVLVAIGAALAIRGRGRRAAPPAEPRG